MTFSRDLLTLFFLAFIVPATGLNAEEKVLKIYHDADYSNHFSSAESMRMGLKTALDEVNEQVQGYKIEVVPKDHRGNSNRSMMHMKQFIKDPDALFMLGGLHSPPYIKYRDFINQNSLLLLVPWAAGGPITRYSEGKNWVFRLSIDDSKAGFRIVDFSLKQLNCTSPHLLLEDTPWGHSNEKTMTRALKDEGHSEATVSWFNWNTKTNQARIILREILTNEDDCILFVGNAIEGEIFSKALASLPNHSVSLISHWGITGGSFADEVPAKIRNKINLHFIQTCFSFVSSKASPLSEKVFQRVKELFPDSVNSTSDIPAPPGLIHAYDLTKITLAAMNQIELKGEAIVNRGKLRAALENLNYPVKGLIKLYNPPFSEFNVNTPDAHEALGLEDFCMGKYEDDNSITVFDNRALETR